MCRWIAYSGTPIFMEDLISKPDHSLIAQSISARKAKVAINGDGFGLGWYGDRAKPGLYHEVLPAWNDRNLASLAEQVRSGLFFAHVRASTGTETSRSNCHPFSHGTWLFMHNGQIGDYNQVRRHLEARLSDELYDARQGTTDSELLFLLAFQAGLEEDPQAAINRMLVLVEEEMAAAGCARSLRFTAAFSDGARLVAVRYANDALPPSLFYCHEGDQLYLVSEPLDVDKHHWQPVPSNHILTTAVGAPPRIFPLDGPSATRESPAWAHVI
tara:strand:+ start:2081 stop:2893 length:813 start_codon:yes stop_codon:yes gene_type:complete